MRLLEQQEVVKRKNRLLQTVIMEFIRTGHPVASSEVAKLDGMNLSSATVRNLLHELERAGFLTHPHTSAGRMPTDKGYRYYVDYLVNLQESLSAEQQNTEREYNRKLEEIENLMNHTSRTLAFLSHHAGFVLRPRMEASKYQHMELIPLDAKHLLLVLVATNGFVRHKIISLPRALDAASLRQVSRWANKHFQGRNLKALCLGFADEMEEHFTTQMREMEGIVDVLSDPIEHLGRDVYDEELSLEGTANLLVGPDVSMTPSGLREIAATLEDRDRLVGLLKKELAHGSHAGKGKLSVVIGEEALAPSLKDLSLVAKSFETSDHVVGLLGILGPKRMDYGKMMSLVENIHNALQKAMKDHE